MAPLKSIISIVVVFLLSASLTASESNIRMFPTINSIATYTSNEQYCESWKFSFEAGNAGHGIYPSKCKEFVMKYLHTRYSRDSRVVGTYSYEFAKTVKISNSSAWIFDIDETLLSQFDSHMEHGYGSENFKDWMQSKYCQREDLPALPASKRLYRRLRQLGFNIILLTGRLESCRNSTEHNLLKVGYSDWVQLIMRGPFDKDKTAMDYKSNKRAQLVYEGYILHGNSGDQWSDLLGYALATRSFKLPNPVYNIP